MLAHPGSTSLSRLFAEIVRTHMSAAGHECDLLDLYQSGFDPVLNETERDNYYSNPPRTDAIASHARLLTAANTLVLIFPTWWFGLPAILKGWIDRVFAPTIAFDHADNFGPIRSRLTNLENVLIITTLGSPAWIDWLVLRRPVRRILKTAVFKLCAPQARFAMLSLYKAEVTDERRLNAFSLKIKSALERTTVRTR